MPGTLSDSPQEKRFTEYLELKRGSNVDAFIAAIDSLCQEIAKLEFMGADKDNALEHLNKLAIGLNSEQEFFEMFSSRNFSNHYRNNQNGNNLRNAYKAFYNFVDTCYTEESFAKYMVGRYRLGYSYLARYLAAVLFEQIIERKAKLLDKEALIERRKERADRRYDPEPTLDDYINLLTEPTLRQDSVFNNADIFTFYYNRNGECLEMGPDGSDERVEQTRQKLLNFKKFRNGVAHDIKQKESMSGTSLDIVCYVWSELLPEDFKKYKEAYKKNGKPDIMAAINEIEADYMVRGIDETTKIEEQIVDFKAVQPKDFEVLLEMRKKLLSLRDEIKRWFASELKPTGLTTDILTTIDTTSAYIWMPLVPYDSKVSKKLGIYNCAVSILATPMDFRVYMDFGGYANEDRFAYYQFLESPEYTSFMESFEGKEGLKVFDIDWYCFITKSSKITPQKSPILFDKMSDRIEEAKTKLLDPSTTLPISWNRMLHGYIIDRSNIPTEGITLDWIKEKLSNIIKFYQEFKKFKAPITLNDYREGNGE